MTEEVIVIDSLADPENDKRLRKLFFEVKAEALTERTDRAMAPWTDPSQGNRLERRRLKKAYRKVRNA